MIKLITLFLLIVIGLSVFTENEVESTSSYIKSGKAQYKQLYKSME